jgi:hypothetical protein
MIISIESIKVNATFKSSYKNIRVIEGIDKLLSILNKPAVVVIERLLSDQLKYKINALGKREGLPSRKLGRKPSMSISGTLSNTVIHPTKNCLT